MTQEHNESLSLEQQVANLSAQMAELVAMQKAAQPTERDTLTQQLADAKKRKDFSAVVSLSNTLARLE